jgi:protein-tyrosine-phosphatase
MNILFVCVANRFRSKSAEALFNKYNKDKNNLVKSAGVRLDPIRPFMAKEVIDELMKKGAKPNMESAQPVNDALINWADRIIVVASNVDPSMFPKSKVEYWPVQDASEHELTLVKKSIDDIDSRVKAFVKDMKQST